MKKSTLAAALKKAEVLNKAIEAEIEEILEDAEKAVKHTTPAISVRATLNKIEKQLEAEGVEALFQKKTSVAAMKKTASEKLSDKEIDEIAKKISEAVVDEIEDVLKDADEIMDEDLKDFNDDEVEVEGKLKSVLEKKLSDKGIYVKFARNKKPAKVASSVKATNKLAELRKNKK